MVKEELMSFLNGQNSNLAKLTIFWRIILLPFMIYWFLFQLVIFSGFMGAFIIFLGILNILMVLSYKNCKEEILDTLPFILVPIVAPFVWWYRYFKFGEFGIDNETKRLCNNKTKRIRCSI